MGTSLQVLSRGKEYMRLNIAVVQFSITQFAPEENLRKAEQFIQAAVSQHAQIIVFPEDFVTGPLSGNSEFADYEGRYVKHFQRLAAQYALDIVPGSIIEGHSGGLYNTTYYIDKTGEIKGSDVKVNLWIPERTYLCAGSQWRGHVCAGSRYNTLAGCRAILRNQKRFTNVRVVFIK